MTAPAATVVVRSSVPERADATRAAVARVVHGLRTRYGLDLVLPALLVFVIEWQDDVPVAACLVLALATVALLVTVQVWVGRRRSARIFPAGERVTVTAGPAGLAVSRGEEPPLVDARWRAFDAATVVRGHLVLSMRGSSAVLVLPAGVSDPELVDVVRAELGGDIDAATLQAEGAAEALAAPPVSPDPAVGSGPERVTSGVLGPTTSARMARDFTLHSMTRPASLVIIGVFVVSSLVAQLPPQTAARWLMPAVAVAVVAGSAILTHRRVSRMLKASPAGQTTLTFGPTGLVSRSEVSTDRLPYAEFRGVAVRGDTVMLRNRNGLTCLFPLSMFPEPLLDEARRAIARAGR